MSNITINKVLNLVAAEIDIPESSYETANKRYKTVSAWFVSNSARCAVYNPHLYPQGSFRLGTVIRPVKDDGEYDLDMGCRLRSGVLKTTHTQKQLKELIGGDVEAYRLAQGFVKPREEKNRCWRLHYSDAMNFHLDMVPSIPADAGKGIFLREAMVKRGAAEALATSAASHAGAITDITLPNYGRIDGDWLISNSEGYALWFESKMEQARPLMEKWASEAKAAQVDKLPAQKRKSPLQKIIQLMKRHRDVMFADSPDGKPISVIITTLASEAYTGEIELDDALEGILAKMEGLVRSTAPYVPNPVNPEEEDFADKWTMSAYAHLRLKQNFHHWCIQLKQDFRMLTTAGTAEEVLRQAKEAFGVDLPVEPLRAIAGLGSKPALAPVRHTISAAPKPWCRG